MISMTLFKKEFKCNYKIILLFLAIVSMYGSVIVAMYDPKLGNSLELMAQSMPEIFAAFGMSSSGTTLIEFVTNYLYGFILIVIPLIFIILMSSRLVARYVDRGSMAYLLATPNKRTKIITTQAIVMILSLLCIVVYTTVLVIVCSNMMFNEEIDIAKFTLINIGLFGLLIFLSGMCFLSACWFNETKLSIGVGAGLSIFFILVQMLSQVGDKMEFLKYMTPLTLFQPEKLLNQNSEAIIYILILYGLGFIMFIIGILIFKRKDLSL